MVWMERPMRGAYVGLTSPHSSTCTLRLHLANSRFTMHYKALRRLSAAQALNHNSPSDPCIKFRCKHPSSPSTPTLDYEEA